LSTPFLALLVLPLDASCFESCPCSTCFTCHHEIPAKLCLLPTNACPLHVVLMKLVERASNGACMINFN
jgi:hypothetical protein